MSNPYEVRCLACGVVIVLVEGSATRWSHFGGGSYNHDAVPPADKAVKPILEAAQVDALMLPPATEKPVGTFDFEDTSDIPGKATILHLVDLGRRLQEQQ